MGDIAGPVESLEIFRVLSKFADAFDFHVHWTASNGGQGCTVKSLARATIVASQYVTLARIGLSEQALTGARMDSLDVKCVINLQRTAAGSSSLILPGAGNGPVEALLSLPGGKRTIPIPIHDREPEHNKRALNGRLNAKEDEGNNFVVWEDWARQPPQTKSEGWAYEPPSWLR